jgi:hypothetical protein
MAILIGFFVAKKKIWARNFMIVLLIILILERLVLHMVATGSILHLQSDMIIESIILLAIIFILTRKSTVAVFSKRITT